ncbi:MAG TPA: response regulator, partial [Planctomycetota bacterium]|nr:response regulator [Planctomycetota bacterium]
VGDGGRIRQILLNLCSNAIKFTSIGHVLLRVRCTGPATAVPTFELRVEDTGIGIPAAARSRLFRKFEQGRGDTAQRHGGTGLGLAISRQLAELMHGSLEVQSTEGQGSTFTLALPLPRAAASGAALPPSLHGRRLLLVGGHAALRDAHARSCRAAGAECIAVADGAGATAAVKEHGFDTAVVQHGLPDCDLDQAITRLRLLAPKLRILVLSSAPRVELEHRLAELGASGLLGLPVRLPLLLDALVAVGNVEPGTFIGRGALALRGRRNRQPAPQLGLHVLLADDSPVTQNLVRLLLERAACTVEVVGNGRQALEAWSQQHFDLLLLDCRMPEMDGLTATREIRRREVAGARTPIFALTADALQTDRDRCQQAGMDRHISKPIDRNALYAALQSLPPRPLGTQPSLLPG